jgi:nucleotide-binding universal stress UspA family protein
VADIQQILVHVDGSRAAARRLAAACGLARRMEAALTALYTGAPGGVEILPFTPVVRPGASPSPLATEDQRRDQARKVFDECRRASGFDAAWAQTSRLPMTEAFTQQALFADLLVLGQHDPADAESGSVPADFVESVLLASGRPGLVLPHIGIGTSIGSTVAIAWKETPEAARAVTAALPFLRQARRVHVLAWGGEEPPAAEGQPLDLERYLHAHGVAFTWDRAGAGRQQIGELLLSRAFDFGADLLVMGCYGHSRAHEWILGGASRTILQSMTLPVLMQH